jgi:farnesyl diphosphate synthase
MRYSVLAGGKRLRPALVLATADMLGASPEVAAIPAVAVELVHVYSLIHDDLPAMDDDDWRRGQPSCHKAFDEATAILAGDALQTLAFEILAGEPMAGCPPARRLAMMHELALACGTRGMGGGQALDLDASGKTLTLAALRQLHGWKTGALIRASVVLGALCAVEADDADVLMPLRTFAEEVGLAFQIQDDILDVVGDQQRLGKMPGSDSARDKTTYVTLLGVEGARQEALQRRDLALQALEGLPYNTDSLRAFAHLAVDRDH